MDLVFFAGRDHVRHQSTHAFAFNLTAKKEKTSGSHHIRVRDLLVVKSTEWHEHDVAWTLGHIMDLTPFINVQSLKVSRLSVLKKTYKLLDVLPTPRATASE